MSRSTKPEPWCPEGSCPSVGVDAVDLEPFEAVETDGGDLIVYDDGEEEAWIQSDVHRSRSGAV